MQKSKWMMLLGACFVLAAAVIFSRMDGSVSKARFHQHLKAASEKDLPASEKGSVYPEPLTTHLPILVINTQGQEVPGRPIPDASGVNTGFTLTPAGASEITASYKIIDEKNAWHHETDTPSSEGVCCFRIRGNSSRWFDKASYRMRLVEGVSVGDPVIRDNLSMINVKKSLMDMPAGNEWALYGPFLDKTLIRNYMWMNLSGEILTGWTPNVRFCEVVLNGDYQGLYVLMEMVDVSSQRLNLTDYDEGDLAPSYVVRIEPDISADKFMDNFTFYTYRMEPGRKMELIYPGLRYQSDYVKRYVETDFSSVERMLYDEGSGDWKQEVDLDSFVDYYIIEEFLGVNDVFSASTYFYRDSRGKLCIGPVWDFNNCLDNFFTPLPEEEFMMAQRGWFGQMMRDEEFVRRVISRYRSLRKGVLSDEHLLSYIRETDEYLGSAVDRNYAVWGYSFNPENLNFRQYKSPEKGSDTPLENLNPDSFEEANEWMIEYMLQRAAWLDEHIESLRQYCHPSKNQ